ncbi:transposase domain-containing protein [Legionella fallonii]|uniref:transposase domain-containing protein n=1 Tax=Legionella fallonii TaxID=96230 RepID=UPI001E486D16|nr:transposase domain-containing protein [Legionella fallonii]
METSKQHQVEVFSWLKYVLANIHQAQTIRPLVYFALGQGESVSRSGVYMK